MENIHFDGLKGQEVLENRKRFGTNQLKISDKNSLWHTLSEIIFEPLFILLVCTALIYFGLGETQEGIIIICALFFVSGISLFQEHRSRNAVESLKKIASSKVKVFRDGALVEILTEEIVMEDIIYLEDGNIIPADAEVIYHHDLAVDESILTGESLPVYKSQNGENAKIFRGCHLVSGACAAKVFAVGLETSIGKIGLSMEQIVPEKTPLQLQIRNFTGKMVVFGTLAFLVVCVMNYTKTQLIIDSLLKGLTLAMSVLPEEIPVAFSTFMALGAYHLFKKGLITKVPSTVETLGAATVICTDKTGTLTRNMMHLSAIYDFKLAKLYDYTSEPFNATEVLEWAMWASEPEPYDKMEITIHQVYKQVCEKDERESATMIAEYPLSGQPPFMTHVYSHETKGRIIAVKGGVEAVLKQSTLTEADKMVVLSQMNALASKGFRVLGVGRGILDSPDLPEKQTGFEYDFIGLISFYDPPKDNTHKTLASFYKAGINVKMITGDHAHTAVAIAKQIKMNNPDVCLDGAELMAMSMPEVREKIKGVNVFTRMFPEAKLRVIEALKLNGEIVAMTGDGVNDGPALKAAHIGVAMGNSGSEVAKNAASLILMDDDLKWMVDAVALGRRIYENLKKAIRYIISIHIPVMLIVSLPVLFSWRFTDIFTPVHVVFLELIMGPTCSIVFENEPIEKNSMSKTPRKKSDSLFSLKELTISILQGLIITLFCLGIGYYYMVMDYEDTFIRTMIYSILIFSNIFLTLVNRSFYYSVFTTFRYKNKLMIAVLLISLSFLVGSIYITPIRQIFGFSAISLSHFFMTAGLALCAVAWIEVYKFVMRMKRA